MNTLSDEEFEQIYGRKPVRRVKKKKIYWNRIIIALIILIGIVTGLVKLTALVVSKIKGDDTQKTNKVLNNTSSVAVKEDASSAEDKKDEPAKYSNMDFTVCVDAGHGDYDGGTTDASGKRYEKDDNLKVALEVQKYLEKYGVNVVMIRDDDSFLELDERCAKANNAKADMYVSLHRSEGFGLVMAESMYVGTPVIATDWSGNTEFMNSDTACMVGYDMIELDKDYEPFKKGNVWADAHVDEAADYMRRLYEDKDFYERIADSGQKYAREHLAYKRSADIVSERLKKIHGEN